MTFVTTNTVVLNGKTMVAVVCIWSLFASKDARRSSGTLKVI